MKSELLGYIEQIRDELIAHNLFIYNHPEVSFKEVKTSGYLADWAKENGFDVEMGSGILSTAFIAKKVIGKGGINAGFIAEYDALEGLGHGCGHNLISTMSFGGAFALAKIAEENNIDCEISILGTPAEEFGGGKIHMIESGYFDRIDFALMLHPSDRTMVEDFSFANAIYSCKFYGKSAHASAAPWEGNNAVEGMLQTLNLINGYRCQFKDYSRIHPLIVESGTATNVIGNYAEMHINIRSIDNDYLDTLISIVEKCAESCVFAYGLRLEMEQISHRYMPVSNSKVLEKLMERNFEYFDIKVLPKLKDQGVGSTDMGNVTHQIPAIHGHIELGQNLKTHTVDFMEATVAKEGERALILGAKVLAMTAYDLIENVGELERMKKEFATRGDENEI